VSNHIPFLTLKLHHFQFLFLLFLNPFHFLFQVNVFKTKKLNFSNNKNFFQKQIQKKFHSKSKTFSKKNFFLPSLPPPMLSILTLQSFTIFLFSEIVLVWLIFLLSVCCINAFFTKKLILDHMPYHQLFLQKIMG
jgi:hypothetical protein